MKRPLSFLTLLIFTTLCLGQGVLKKQKLTDDIRMMVPSELYKRQPSIQKSTSPVLAMFTSQDGQAELVLNKSSLQWGNDDPELVSRFYKANIFNLYDEVKMIQEDIRTIDGEQVIFFEFVGAISSGDNAFSSGIARKDYLIVAYKLVPDGILIFRFSCVGREQSMWQQAMNEAYASLKF